MKKLSRTIIIIFILLLLIKIDEYKIITSTLDNTKTDFNYIRKIYNNNDIVARLEIPYLFNIYITKTKDNEYYLNHSLDKRYDIRGTPFIDYQSTIYNNQINIYGHNSIQFNLPFKALTKYLEESFFKTNNIIYLEINSELRTYVIFILKEVTNNNEHMKYYKDKQLIYHIDKLKEDSIYINNISYNENSELLILQTCTLKNPNSYYLICAIRI